MSALDRVVGIFDDVHFAKSLDFIPDKYQSLFLQSNHTRFILPWTRQGGKSTITSLKAYALSKTDIGLGIIISPSERQSKELMLKIKEFYHKDIYSFEFDGRESKTEVLFKNGSRIVALPANVDTIRGYSAPKWIIFDEAAMIPDAVYKAVRPMLATVPDSKLFLISTPKGKRGFFYREWISTSDKWFKLKVTAHMIDRISSEFLKEERESLGEKWFKQEYECEFLNVNEQLFDMDIINSAFVGSISDLELPVKESKISTNNSFIFSERYKWLNNIR